MYDTVYYVRLIIVIISSSSPSRLRIILFVRDYKLAENSGTTRDFATPNKVATLRSNQPASVDAPVTSSLSDATPNTASPERVASPAKIRFTAHGAAR